MRRRPLGLLLALCLIASVRPAWAAVPPEAARRLLGQWIQAQNRGDFATYRALYSTERFEGIKRAGKKRRVFGRAAWLADRRKMFARRLEVSADDITVKGDRLIFTQTWASGSFKDRGPKRLDLVMDPSGWPLIRREEMLRSKRLPAASEARPPSRPDLALILAPGKTPVPLIVLDTGAKASWAQPGAKGRLLLQGDGRFTTWIAGVAARASALPPEHRGWAGARIDLYGSTGKTCQGIAGDPIVVAAVEPSGQSDHFWGLDVSAKRSSQVAQQILELTDRRLLVVPVPCPAKGAVWARRGDRPGPAELYQAGAPPPALRGAGRDALRKTKGFQPRWLDLKGLRWISRVFERPGGGRRYLFVGLTTDLPCEQLEAFQSGGYWGLWEVVDWGEERPAMVLLSGGRRPGPYLEPRAAADLDGDGRIELIAAQRLAVAAGPVHRVAYALEPDQYWDCGGPGE